MSATKELRRMLDERGVEWKDGDASHTTEWTTDDGRHCSAMYWKPTLSVLISGCTPEQAIVATLGGGECEQVIADYYDGLMPPFTAHCSKCGAEWGFTPRFCPECGAKVTGTRDERKAVKR